MKHTTDLLAGEVILQSHFAILCAPKLPHISAQDGGHLFASLIRPISSRVDATPKEMLDLCFLSIVATKCLAVCFESDWFNYQENGNWSMRTNHHVIHQHIYGRKKDSVNQPFGEALRFPMYEDIASWDRNPYTAFEIQNMKVACEKYASDCHQLDYLTFINSDKF